MKNRLNATFVVDIADGHRSEDTRESEDVDYNYFMSMHFSRSLRALRTDSFRASQVGLIFALLNMTILVFWFFLARVTLYEISTSIAIGQDGRILVEFPASAKERLRPGQSAILRIDTGAEGQRLSVPAMVNGPDMFGSSAIEILVLDPTFSASLTPGKLKGQLEVEVEYVTPAELVLRASDKLLSRDQISVSPRESMNPQP